MIRRNLGFLKIKLGEAEDAILLAEKNREAEEKYQSNIFSFTSEQQRLTFPKQREMIAQLRGPVALHPREMQGGRSVRRPRCRHDAAQNGA